MSCAKKDTTPPDPRYDAAAALLGAAAASYVALNYERIFDASLRCLFAIAGMLLLLPAGALPFSRWRGPIGFALAVAIFGREWLFERRTGWVEFNHPCNTGAIPGK
jgi:hypothetical protein